MKKEVLLPVLGAFLSVLFMSACREAEGVRKPNVLLICVDDLRPELKSFGAHYIHSPHIDALAKKGVSFQNHYVNAPSCGPSRYTLLTGLYGPSGNNALFKRADKIAKGKDKVTPSMPEWFRTNGYTTVSVGKVSHHPGGRGGANWNDSTIIEMPAAWDKQLMPVAQWEHPRGAMHGLAYGEIRKNAKDMAVFQAQEGDDAIYPDGAITEEALTQLKELATDNDKPFFMAVGIIKPHLPFGAPKSYLEQYKEVVLPEIQHPQKPTGRTTWHASGEFNQYNLWGKDPNTDKEFAEEIRRHYAAAVSYADAQVGKILAELKRNGADKNTIVVLWGDHGYHLGEHAIWGKHSLFEESLHSPLIIHYPGMSHAGANSEAIIQTLDIFPTLCDLTGVEVPEFAQGASLRTILEEPTAKGHFALSYFNDASSIRTKTHRMTLHKDGFVELYDQTTTEGETNNVADKYPDVVLELKQILQKNLVR
ncbi:iduronate 2-sulfatase [Arenibacter nanhaiticus]|uniref:Iduronate 2-sulfatase n=1 Tax=Arenibacter nanhaiticus TaxID=558155 RepID=A0A1M6LEM8_9FLAO|nr:sulfatase [Arenibacter nanhaiticus]SHJ69612.1 iduronate 2-sulfatase [Arenibacter nanhaiticus]